MEITIEKKKLQRIIGVLIIVAAVIVLIPLFFNRQVVISPSSDAAQMTVPAVSDQPMAAAAPMTNPETPTANHTNTTTNTETENANSLPPANVSSIDASMNSAAPGATVTRAPATALDTQLQTITSSAAPKQPAVTVQTAAPAAQPQATVKYVGDTVEVTPAPATNVNANANVNVNVNPPQNLDESTAEITPAIAADINKKSYIASNTTSNKPNMASNVVQIKNNLTTDTAMRVNPALNAPKGARGSSFGKPHRVANNLLLPKKSAWVVQMGSFKNKSNAHRLVSRLKASGFKAFMHETQSSTGSIRTAVYVGPEFKEVSAAKLSTNMMSKIHIRGFVVPYKPMVF